MRLRPIMMTTFAAVLGAVPLAIGIGQGASLRQPLGITVMGGLILSQVFTLYTTPVIYLYLDRLRAQVARWSARPAVESPPRSNRIRTHHEDDLPHYAGHRRAGAAGRAALMLGGCMVGPDYHRAAVPTPAT